MAGDDKTTTSTATATASTATGAGGVSREEFKVLEGKLDALIETLHAGGQDAVKAKLGADQSIADQVQAELDRRDKAAKDEQSRQELTTIKEELAKLRESKPVEPLRRVTRFLLGNPDRGQSASSVQK